MKSSKSKSSKGRSSTKNTNREKGPQPLPIGESSGGPTPPNAETKQSKNLSLKLRLASIQWPVKMIYKANPFSSCFIIVDSQSTEVAIVSGHNQAYLVLDALNEYYERHRD